MASWRDQMRPAKFRDVPFFVESAEMSGGRKTIVHEFPLRDQPFAEDLGLKARSFPVEGYVIGDDYIAKRDALMTELEKSGNGELQHPYFGTKRVAVVSFRVRESAREGGMATFSIEFAETPAKPAQPTAIPDAAGKLTTSAAAARTSIGDEFLATYVTNATLKTSVAYAINSAAVAVDTALARVQQTTEQVAAMKRRITNLQGNVASLMAAPETLLESFVDLFDAIGAGATAALLEVYAFDAGPRPPETTANRIIEETNYDATQKMIQRLVLVRAAEVALTDIFDSYEDAVTMRETLTDLLDEQADTAIDDLYPMLQQLRADVVKALPDADGGLPHLLRYTPAVTVPSLVLAFRLYGNLDLESDLIARNQIRRPGFVLGGQELEVLSSE